MTSVTHREQDGIESATMRPFNFIVFLFSTSCLSLVATPTLPARADEPDRSTMRIEFSQRNDRASITVSKAEESPQTFLEIRSERGIGSCTVHRTTDHWPSKLTLRLPLRGLEQLAVQNGDSKWIGSVSSSDRMVRWNRKTGQERETPMRATDSEWCMLRRVSAEGASKPIRVPLSEGEYWEMTIPSVWLNDNPSSIRIDWVDFFR